MEISMWKVRVRHTHRFNVGIPTTVWQSLVLTKLKYNIRLDWNISQSIICRLYYNIFGIFLDWTSYAGQAVTTVGRKFGVIPLFISVINKQKEALHYDKQRSQRSIYYITAFLDRPQISTVKFIKCNAECTSNAVCRTKEPDQKR